MLNLNIPTSAEDCKEGNQSMDETQLRKVMREEMQDMLRQHSKLLGIDPEMQVEWQKRFAFLDGLYLSSQQDRGWLRKTARPVLVTGGLTAVWHAVITYLKQL